MQRSYLVLRHMNSYFLKIFLPSQHPGKAIMKEMGKRHQKNIEILVSKIELAGVFQLQTNHIQCFPDLTESCHLHKELMTLQLRKAVRFHQLG